jgi:hypothetical protein
MVPFHGLSLHFRVVIVNPCFISCDIEIYEGGSFFELLQLFSKGVSFYVFNVQSFVLNQLVCEVHLFFYVAICSRVSVQEVLY